MTELDGIIGPIALDLINEFGKTILFNSNKQGAYNVATGGVTKAIDVYTIKATVENYSGQSFLNGLIEGNDKKVLVASQSFVVIPTIEDTLTIDDINYKIVNVKSIFSGDQAALYELQARL